MVRSSSFLYLYLRTCHSYTASTAPLNPSEFRVRDTARPMLRPHIIAYSSLITIHAPDRNESSSLHSQRLLSLSLKPKGSRPNLAVCQSEGSPPRPSLHYITSKNKHASCSVVIAIIITMAVMSGSHSCRQFLTFSSSFLFLGQSPE